jgi:hypothetical protein
VTALGSRKRLNVSDQKRPGYISFMLRLWQAVENGREVWRASLESPHTGERWLFANLIDLVEFLRKVVGGVNYDGDMDG